MNSSSRMNPLLENLPFGMNNMEYITDDFFSKINFNCDIIYVAIGSAFNHEQQFPPLLSHLKKLNTALMIQCILIDANLEMNHVHVDGVEFIVQRKYVDHENMILIPFLIGHVSLQKLIIVQDFSGHDIKPFRNLIPCHLTRNVLIGMEKENGNCSPDLSNSSLFPLFYFTDQGSIQFISADNSFTHSDIASFLTSDFVDLNIQENVLIRIKSIFDNILQNNFPDWRCYMSHHYGFCSNFAKQYSTETFLSDITNKIEFCKHVDELTNILEPFYYHCNVTIEQNHNQIYNASTVLKKCFQKILEVIELDGIAKRNYHTAVVSELFQITTENRWITW